MRGRAVGLLLVGALAIAACGDDGNGDDGEITKVIERVGTTADPSACSEVETQKFVEQVVGEGLKGKAALKACRQNAEHGVADEVDVSEIEVDGDTATAKAAFRGSTFDGQTLELAFVKDDGTWKLDEFSDFAQFDRAKLVASYAAELRAEAGVPAKAVDCVRGRFDDLTDEQIKQYVLDPSVENVQLVFGPCEKLLGG